MTQVATSPVDLVIAQIGKSEAGPKAAKAQAWAMFKAQIDPLLIAVKYEPHRASDAVTALHALVQRIYNEWLNHEVDTTTIENYVLAKRNRFAQILPKGDGGRLLMEQIITVLTMTTGDRRYDEWGTWIVVDVNYP